MASNRSGIVLATLQHIDSHTAMSVCHLLQC